VRPFEDIGKGFSESAIIFGGFFFLLAFGDVYDDALDGDLHPQITQMLLNILCNLWIRESKLGTAQRSCREDRDAELTPQSVDMVLRQSGSRLPREDSTSSYPLAKSRQVMTSTIIRSIQPSGTPTILFSGFTNTNVPIAETAQRLEIGPLLQNVSGSSYRGTLQSPRRGSSSKSKAALPR
jgi:hypothetical protein